MRTISLIDFRNEVHKVADTIENATQWYAQITLWNDSYRDFRFEATVYTESPNGDKNFTGSGRTPEEALLNLKQRYDLYKTSFGFDGCIDAVAEIKQEVRHE